ncbi:MAG: hypothetical protein LBP50_02300 [Tannerella sp.]|jgi:hypothetical protein|nr:hypothetical protein [Tannerella sp.]
MKKFVFTLSILLVCMTGMNAQVYSTLFHRKDAFKTYPALKLIAAEVPVKQMPELNVETLLAEDREVAGLDVPFRFGYGFEASYTLEDGHWTQSDDVNVWNLKIASGGAYSLNFIFDRLSLVHWEIYARVYKPAPPYYDWIMVGNPPSHSIILDNSTVYYSMIGGCNVDLKVITVLSLTGQYYSETIYNIPCPDCNLYHSCGDSLHSARASIAPVINAYPVRLQLS